MAVGRKVDLGGILGETVDLAVERLGPPEVDRRVGGERWLVFETPAGSLRVRARGPKGQGTVRSWTLTAREPFSDIDRAGTALGLDLEPPLPVDRASEAEPLRRALRSGSALASVTASGSPDGVRAITVFDEPPDWRPSSE